MLAVNNIEVIYDHVILVLKGVSLEVPMVVLHASENPSLPGQNRLQPRWDNLRGFLCIPQPIRSSISTGLDRADNLFA